MANYTDTLFSKKGFDWNNFTGKQQMATTIGLGAINSATGNTSALPSLGSMAFGPLGGAIGTGASLLSKGFNDSLQYDELGRPKKGNAGKRFASSLLDPTSNIGNIFDERLNTAEKIGSIIPGLGGIIMNNAEAREADKNFWKGTDTTRAMDNMNFKNNNIPSLKCGGKLKRENGGLIPDANYGKFKITDYKGYKHTDGGIKIGDRAEVEKGEIRWDNKGESYIFSNYLKVK